MKRSSIISFLVSLLLIAGYATTELKFNTTIDNYQLTSQQDLHEIEEIQQHFNIDSSKFTILILENSNGWQSYRDFKTLDTLSQYWKSYYNLSSITELTFPKRRLGFSTSNKFIPLKNEEKFNEIWNNREAYTDIFSKFISANNQFSLFFLETNDKTISEDQLHGFNQVCNRFSGVSPRLLQYERAENEMRSSSISDTLLITVICLFLVISALYLFIRSSKGIIITLICVLSNLSLLILILFATNTPFSMFMISVPSIIVILSFTDIVHILYYHNLLKDQFSSQIELRKAIISKVKTPMLLTSLTNCIGFLLFLFLADNTLLFELSLVSFLGIVASYLNTRFIIVRLLRADSTYFNARKSIKISTLFTQINAVSLQYRKLLLTLVLITTATCFAFIVSSTQINYSPKDYIPQHTEFYQNQQILQEHFFGSKQGEVLVRFKTKGELWTTENTRLFTEIETEVNSIFNTQFVSSPNTIVKRFNRFYFNGMKSAFKIPAEFTANYKTLLNNNISKLGGDELLSKNQDLVKIKFGFSENDLPIALEKYANLSSKLKDLSTDKIELKLSGKSILADQSVTTFSRQLIIGFLISILFSSIFMYLVAQRKIKARSSLLLSVGVLIVNLLPLFIVISVMHLFNYNINPLNLFFLSILLGVCVDDSIFIGTQFIGKENTIRKLPILITSSILTIGFLAFAFSDFSFIQPFAGLFFIGIMSALLLDLFVLPLFLEPKL